MNDAAAKQDSNAWDAHKALVLELASLNMAGTATGAPGSPEYGQFLGKLAGKLGDAITLHQATGYDARVNALPDLLLEIAGLGKCAIGSVEFGSHLAKIDAIVKSLKVVHGDAVRQHALEATPLLFGPRLKRPAKKGGKA